MSSVTYHGSSGSISPSGSFTCSGASASGGVLLYFFGFLSFSACCSCSLVFGWIFSPRGTGLTNRCSQRGAALSVYREAAGCFILQFPRVPPRRDLVVRHREHMKPILATLLFAPVILIAVALVYFWWARASLRSATRRRVFACLLGVIFVLGPWSMWYFWITRRSNFDFWMLGCFGVLWVYAAVDSTRRLWNEYRNGTDTDA